MKLPKRIRIFDQRDSNPEKRPLFHNFRKELGLPWHAPESSTNSPSYGTPHDEAAEKLFSSFPAKKKKKIAALIFDNYAVTFIEKPE